MCFHYLGTTLLEGGGPLPRNLPSFTVFLNWQTKHWFRPFAFLVTTVEKGKANKMY